MTSKEALKDILGILINFEHLSDIDDMHEVKKQKFDIVEKDLDRLEKLEKAIEIILKYKIRPSTFVLTIKNYREMYGKDLTLEKAYILLDFCGTQEEYKLLKEVLENDK